jgi:formylglycine-generating enzyme required for sulfatase activity
MTRAQGVAAGTDPREIQGGRTRRYQVAVNDREIVLSSASDTAQDDSKRVVGSMQSSNQHFTIEDAAATPDRSFWKNGKKPTCVSDFGTDQYGAWFEFSVPAEADDDSSDVTQRMRWNPSGEFMMGSSEDEEGRWDDEGPLHTVTLTKGFWLAETTCTQELWQAVMGDNPSEFKGDQLPVENVSWEDVQKFEQTLPDQLSGLELGLPTEAQWEYACRAGTDTRYWFGDTCDKGHANIESHVGQTSEVKSYAANPLGLFDMHGNVWEWCQDYCRDTYDDGTQVDPQGPSENKGSYRVIRGGSWSYLARFARSAFRSRVVPGDRDVNLGFRCLSSVAEPSELAEVPVAEQGPQPTRVGEAGKKFAARPVKVSLHEVTTIQTGGTVSRLAISTDLEELHVTRLTRPAWATMFGRDAFGVYGDFQLPADATSAGVRQRLRWIPPGRFRMGSPPDESGRYENELLHEVTISAGFWIFDTPCTQELWQAIMGMGDNPSRFPDPQRPVEMVDWKQAHEFADKLTSQIPSLSFSLPTEAQWEYACRAGTTTAIYSGPLEILGNANAPALDDIAWYGGNSGHEFDHEQPEDISGYDWLSEKQYDFSTAGTRRVKQKHPNPWGLYDMLGNVWEWCRDCWRDSYDDGPQVDPQGPAASDGSLRVFRGGGWSSVARVARSAVRNGSAPGIRSDYLGFRCMSSVSQVAEQVSASKDEPRDEAVEKRRTQ